MAAENFASQLRRHRTLAGLSQQALAARAGLSRRGIADLERGARRTPYPDTARRLAAALGLRGAERDTFMAACHPSSRRGQQRHRLSIKPTHLVGRGHELRELAALVDATRLLTLTGAGGIGKTRLALALAHTMEDSYADGAVAVDLAPVLDQDAVTDAVISALDLPAPRRRAAIDIVAEHVHDRHLLLILDNCEHLVASCATLVDAMLRSAAGLTVVLTSREALRLPGETVWTVPPMAQDEAVDLFAAYATTARPAAGACLRPTQTRAAAEICRRLEGIPLAIELAAVRARVLGVEEVAGLLTDRLDFLSHGNRLDPPRHQTLRATLDWSHSLLNAEEQRLFAELSVFVGGWTLPAAEAISRADSTAVVDQLTGLVDKSLVLLEDVETGRRFRFLETIREYAGEHLRDKGTEASIRDRHAAYLHRVAVEGAVSRLGMQYPGDVRQIWAEWPNLQAALRWLRARDRLDEGLALCTALSGFWLGQGLLRDGAEWLDAFLAAPERLSARALGAGLHARGRLLEYGGAFDQAQDLYQRARTISVDHGDLTVTARATCGLADVALHHGAYVDAHDLFGLALEAARAAGAEAEQAQCLLSLGRSALLLSDLEACRQWLDQALVIERRLGDRWGVAYVLQLSGEQARQAGRWREAQTLLEEAHVLWRQAGTKMGERSATMTLAMLAAQLGELPRAHSLIGDALALSEELDDITSATTVRVVEVAAEVLGASGETVTAARLLAAATARRTAIDAPRPTGEQPEIEALLGRVRRELGDDFGSAWEAGLGWEMDRAFEVAATAVGTLS